MPEQRIPLTGGRALIVTREPTVRSLRIQILEPAGVTGDFLIRLDDVAAFRAAVAQLPES